MLRAMGTDAGAPRQPAKAMFYRFTDPSGRVHIVDSLDLVPQALRSHAHAISYDEESALPALPSAPGVASAPATFPERLRALPTWQLAVLAVGAALLIELSFRRMPGALRLLLRVALVAGVVALASSAYFGWLRRTTGQSGAGSLATPGALLDDAKGAVEKMNARVRAQQAELKEIEQTK